MKSVRAIKVKNPISIAAMYATDFLHILVIRHAPTNVSVNDNVTAIVFAEKSRKER
jgi:hypothetical protein